MGIEIDTFVFYGTALTDKDIELLEIEDELHIRQWAIMPLGGNNYNGKLKYYLVYKPSLTNVSDSIDEPTEIKFDDLQRGISKYIDVNPVAPARKQLLEVTQRFDLEPHVFDWYVTSRVM